MIRMMIMVVQKTITIREDQEEYIVKNHLNLSRFVQNKLDILAQQNGNIQTPQKHGGDDQ